MKKENVAFFRVFLYLLRFLPSSHTAPRRKLLFFLLLHFYINRFNRYYSEEFRSILSSDSIAQMLTAQMITVTAATCNDYVPTDLLCSAVSFPVLSITVLLSPLLSPHVLAVCTAASVHLTAAATLSFPITHRNSRWYDVPYNLLPPSLPPSQITSHHPALSSSLLSPPPIPPTAS